MKRAKIFQVCLLAGILLSITLMHACSKEKDCKTCIAKDNGAEVGRAKVCSPEAEASFEFEFEDADETTCN